MSISFSSNLDLFIFSLQLSFIKNSEDKSKLGLLTRHSDLIKFTPFSVYLKPRVRNAVETLIEEDEPDKIEVLEQAGWFGHVKGFLIGRPYCNGEEFLGLDQSEAVTGILGKYNVPIIMDLDIGHIPPAMPLICGSYAKVTSVGNDVEVAMELK